MNEAAVKEWFGDDTVDPIETIMHQLDDTRYYNSQEVGLVHPNNSSLVKIRDNGVIDIFVATNQGIRIDPATKSVNFFTNNEKHHVGNLSAWVEYAVSIEAKRSINLKTLLFDLQATNINMKADTCNIDVPDDKLILAGTTIKQINTRLTNNETAIKDTNTALDATRKSLDDTNNSLSSARDQIGSLKQRLDDMSSSGGNG